MANFLDAHTARLRLLQVQAEGDAIVELADSAEHAWSLAFANETLCLAEWIDEPPRLVVSIDIGIPPAHRTGVVHSNALFFNLLWKESGGARIAQGGSEGELILIGEFQQASVLADDFAAELVRFADFAKAWCLYAASSSAEAKIPSSGQLTAHIV
ncbi:MAG: hypothetical protein EOO22_03180 [Comamonadaceae bacterium]|nr:MAG: hypothetical protein EOO22_03180 [Comamonadaceae bacterium]